MVLIERDARQPGVVYLEVPEATPRQRDAYEEVWVSIAKAIGNSVPIQNAADAETDIPAGAMKREEA